MGEGAIQSAALRLAGQINRVCLVACDAYPFVIDQLKVA